MSKQLFIVNLVLASFLIQLTAYAAMVFDKPEKSPIIITSETLTADNKNSTAVFEGSVIAKMDDITMSSDKMTVFYDTNESTVKKIHCVGNVKVSQETRALFADEATYIGGEEKIIFSGNPKAVEGENVISGKQITFYIKDGRVTVEESRVILQSTQGLD